MWAMEPRSDVPFPNTRWSLVAQVKGRPEAREKALGELCRLYWMPVYAFLRRRGAPAADAQDAVQGFFASLLGEDGFAKADEEVGKMRSFLLGALQRWQRGEWRKSTAQKRGGDCEIYSMDALEAENGFQAEEQSSSPEEEFDRRCAMSILEAALRRLEEEQRAAGKGHAFAIIRPLLSPAGSHVSQEAVARELGLSAEALRVALHRLRKRFGELLRVTIADTLASPTEEAVAEEMAALRRVLVG